ncbi:MAG: sugar phosphate nucleotidyltransferase [Anaerolineales bacterium]|jgi:glucose-1-phosphate thymidylyltransferase
MKIVIPMAGYGTRLRPHTWSKPKPLVSVAGKTILGHVLDMFSSLSDLEEVIFIVGYLGEQIKSFMDENYPDIKASYVIQDEMLGQSHALWLARDSLTGPVYMAFVDTLIEVDLSRPPKAGSQAVAWVKEVEDPRRFGVADVDAEGWVKRLIEKPKDPQINLALVGFYYFQHSEALVGAIEQQMERDTRLGGEYYLVDAINIMLEEGLRMSTERIEVWKDCGKPDALLDTNRYLLAHGRDNTGEALQRTGAVIVPPVFIHPTAAISESVIGPYASVGPECVIQRSIISDSILEHSAFVQDSVISESLVGKGARLIGSRRKVNLGDLSEIDLR